MQVAPVNPDRRPLPPGWQECYDESRRTWFYICTNFEPLHVSEVHPLGPRTNLPPTGLRTLPATPQNSQGMALIRGQGSVPSPSIPAQIPPLSHAQQLYASAVKPALAQPTLPATNISVLTPPPSPHRSAQYRAHTPQISQSYQPAQNHNMLVHRTHANTTEVPMLTTKAEAPKDYKLHESDTRATRVVHTTAALPRPAPPYLHVPPPSATVTYLSSTNSTSNAASTTASVPVYQQLPPTPVSPPQNQGSFTSAHLTGQAVPTPGLPIQVATTDSAYRHAIQQQPALYQPQIGMYDRPQQRPQQSLAVGHSHQQPSVGSQLVNRWVNGVLHAATGGGGGGGGSTDFSTSLGGGGDSSGGGAIDPTSFGGGYFGVPDPTSFGGGYYGAVDPASVGGGYYEAVDPTSFGGGNIGGIDPSVYAGMGGGIDYSSFGDGGNYDGGTYFSC